MIPQGIPARQPCTWQEELASAIRDPVELAARLDLDPTALGCAPDAMAQFPLRVPRPYLARMRRGDAADPLLLQVLPAARELDQIPGYGRDPLHEHTANPVPGLIHKYRGRVLLLPSPACAIHCRYCFRRHYPYQDNTPDTARWEELFAELAADPSIEEVILSGGDPLLVSNRRLSWIVAELAAIPHLQRLRVHTRLPVVIPDRVDEDLPGILAGSRLVPVVVVHANHANEIDTPVAAALCRLADAGITVLNQAVLLRGVNDDTRALAGLSHALLAARALPYYLHLLDPVAGAAHFDVDEARALALLRELAGQLPGYLVPRLVREIPGRPAKTPLPFRW